MVHLGYRVIPLLKSLAMHRQEPLKLFRRLERLLQARKPDARGIYNHFFLPFPLPLEIDPFEVTLVAREVCAVVVALLPLFTASSCLFCQSS